MAVVRAKSMPLVQSVCIAAAVFALASPDPVHAVDLVGYVPYYRMGGSYNTSTLPAQLAMLDEVRYFGLTAASNGTITTLEGTFASHTSRIGVIKNAIAALPPEDRPRLNITLGGAGQASNFATIAGNASLRTTFAENIAALLDQTGATSVDIDWEHPVGSIQFNNYATMLQRIKQEVGAERRVYATIDPTIAVPLSVFDGPNGIDGISLMTYELAWWANDPNDFNRGEHSLPEYVEDSTDAWTEPAGSPNQRPWVFASWGRNAPEDKLGVGMPFFGRVIGTSQSPMAGTAYTYSQLVAGGTTTDGNYYTVAGQPVWIPGPALAAQRVEFAHERGLQHIIIWELGQDLHPSDANSLLRAAYEARESLMGIAGDFNGDGSVDAADYAVWRKYEGTTNELPNDPHGGTIGPAQYGTWLANFGVGGAAARAIPEPRTHLVLIVAALAPVLARWRRAAVH
jgi:hypothetical protein